MGGRKGGGEGGGGGEEEAKGVSKTLMALLVLIRVYGKAESLKVSG